MKMGINNHILLKTFSVSLLIHITGISLFSIIFPLYKPEMKPIEVSILPPSTTTESAVRLAKIEPVTEVPEIITTDEKIAILKKPETIKIATEQFTGSPEYIPITQITHKFEIPEFQVKLPDIISFKSLEMVSNIEKSPTTLEIEGPAGDRGVLYRKKTEYPDWAQEEGMEGNIQIKFWVAPDGKVVLTELVVSSGFPELDIYAEQVLREWLFEPARTDKQAWGIITFSFKLTQTQ